MAETIKEEVVDVPALPGWRNNNGRRIQVDWDAIPVAIAHDELPRTASVIRQFLEAAASSWFAESGRRGRRSARAVGQEEDGLLPDARRHQRRGTNARAGRTVLKNWRSAMAVAAARELVPQKPLGLDVIVREAQLLLEQRAGDMRRRAGLALPS
jgi:hypothetical protein